MCGIAGQVNHGGLPGVDAVTAMVRRLSHRGPDDSGTWRSPGGECVLGHARLSIIDLSAAGHQPMIDPLTGNAIVFNGEIYNFRELRQGCERDGERFHSGTDTEVLLALYRRHGQKMLGHLRGMFAFAIWDEGRRQLFLARDRVGKKPLNYAITPSGLVFASELASLACHPAVSREQDPEALELYFQLQYIPAPRTIYRQVRKLPPAHYAVYDQRGLTVAPYWDVSFLPKRKGISEEEALAGFEEKLREAVRLRLVADVPVGVLLSGGVDSSVVVAIMAGLSPQAVKTYSIGFRDEEFNELPYARMVAELYGTEHCPEVVDGTAEGLLGEIVRHYGEPFADSSAVPSFQVCRAARRHVKVVMNGDGGDELLGGYPRYWLGGGSILAGRLLGDACSPGGLARQAVGLDRVTTLGGRLRRKWLLRCANPELQSLTSNYGWFWNDAERAALLGREGEDSPLLTSWRADWLGRVRAAADNPVDRMLWIDNGTYLPGDLLVKMDIAAMHCGLEARSPLLDHELIEYCATLPVRFKVRQRTGKYLLKRLAERYLPRGLIYRQKMGFAIPLADWLRQGVKPVVEEVLAATDLMEPLDRTVIRQVRDEFYDQGIEHSSRIWALLMYGLWQRDQKAMRN
jgi:asparagine synthase (glutamine-hydrolysing)